MAGIRTVHDFLTVAAAAPLQEAGITALGLPDATTSAPRREYAERRDLMMPILAETGFAAASAGGRLLRHGRLSHLGFGDDVATARSPRRARRRRDRAGLVVLLTTRAGAHLVRFAFCKRLETLEEAGERLRSCRAG